MNTHRNTNRQREEISEEQASQGSRYRNDVSWYSRNPTLLAAAGSLPFPYRPGMTIPWFSADVDATNSINVGIPGVMTLDWYPTVGYSQSATDPASIVGKEIFAKVREKFSGSIDADAPDFVIYLMALDSIFAYIASLKRIYRLLIAYTSENHYIPDDMLKCLGFTDQSIVDLKEHRMQFYQIINELVYMTRKFNIPAVFDIINRHYWLNDNVYMDAQTINSQFYLFRCLGYYKYVVTEVQPGPVSVGSLQMQDLHIPNSGVSEYLFEFGRQLIDALAGSDDAYIISGYLMRAYEGTPVFTVDELPIDDKLTPIYEPEVLMQIENAQPVMWAIDGQSTGTQLANDVSQDPATNAVLCSPTFIGAVPNTILLDGNLSMDNFLSIRSDTPTVADITIATRLKMGIKDWKSQGGSAIAYRIVCGTEVLTRISVNFRGSYISKGSTGVRTGSTLYTSYMYAFNPVTTVDLLQQSAFAVMQSFDWHPILPVFLFEKNGDVSWMRGIIMGDVHNSTILTNEALEQLNRVCLYSEFNSYGQI